MTVSNWQYADGSNAVVMRTYDDGRIESRTISDAEVQAWIQDGNTPLDPPVANPADVARPLLDASDMVAIRCMKAGVAFPVEWLSYVTALRAIVATGQGSIPTKPAYPAGT